jgi:hypothetical protein
MMYIPGRCTSLDEPTQNDGDVGDPSLFDAVVAQVEQDDDLAEYQVLSARRGLHGVHGVADRPAAVRRGRVC